MIRIATRRSALARAQAFQTGTRITDRTGQPVELVPMSSTGDDHPERRVEAFDVKGIFIDTIRQAVLDGDCDVAVHSFKDLPTDPHPDLMVGAIPGRQDPRDLLVTREGRPFSALPAGAIVGTSSERRKLQLLRVKPGLQVLPLRGNLDTRLRKVADGEFDAVVVALAGLKRLYTSPDRGGVGPLDLPLKAVPLEPGEMVPAPAQGAIAIECRADDARTASLLEAVDHLPSRKAVETERAFLAAIEGGCTTPAGALCTLTGLGGLELLGMLGDPVNRRVLRLSTAGGFDQGTEIGTRLGEEMREALGG
ncbi:hydroxymethylbilane synthase [Euzebya tangerina]|uniref:hydroxymethylbilane synthase n=1 Tax=Euzebya tangerina TaxID=591198 RepID=UPI000E31995A|nr:hydroxymethylbilane synthase [Euzebya tangerina]